MRLAQSTIEQVKAYPDLVTIISDYVTLKKKGSNHVGLCPFHSEKTPSFTVSSEKKIFHCFGCHASGDLIAFMMQIDQLSFSESITFIAQRAGIDIVEDETASAFPGTDSRLVVMKDITSAARDYLKTFLIPKSTAFDYLQKRGINKETMAKFHLGYHPESAKLMDHLLEKGFKKEDILSSGLFSISASGQHRFRFSHRVIFPVIDHLGRTVGFGGRLLSDASKFAKYVNSEETPIFNKRRLLYGLDNAKKGINASGFAILMEGYMDVITAHQYGFNQAVASMGTALTRDQVQKLRRYTDTLYVALDNDEAGQLSIERSYDLLKSFDFKVLIVLLTHKDPAEVLLGNGADYFQKQLDNAKHMIEFKLMRFKEKKQISRIEDVPKALNQLIPMLKKEKDTIIINHYTKMISSQLNINEEIVLAKIKNIRYSISKQGFAVQKNRKNKYVQAEEALIYVMASSLDLRNTILNVVSYCDFTDDTHVVIVKGMTEHQVIDKNLIETFKNDRSREKLHYVLVNGENLFGLYREVNWRALVDVIKQREQKKRIDEIKDRIKTLDIKENEKDIQQLLEELNQILSLKS